METSTFLQQYFGDELQRLGYLRKENYQQYMQEAPILLSELRKFIDSSCYAIQNGTIKTKNLDFIIYVAKSIGIQTDNIEIKNVCNAILNKLLEEDVFNILPDEIIFEILSQLPTLLPISIVNKRFRDISADIPPGLYDFYRPGKEFISEDTYCGTEGIRKFKKPLPLEISLMKDIKQYTDQPKRIIWKCPIINFAFYLSDLENSPPLIRRKYYSKRGTFNVEQIVTIIQEFYAEPLGKDLIDQLLEIDPSVERTAILDIQKQNPNFILENMPRIKFLQLLSGGNYHELDGFELVSKDVDTNDLNGSEPPTKKQKTTVSKSKKYDDYIIPTFV